MEEQPTECEPESMDSEDDLFVMFTSGVAETPKGIIHSQAGYLLHVAVTFKVCTITLSFQVYVRFSGTPLDDDAVTCGTQLHTLAIRPNSSKIHIIIKQ